jgi:hypothetical protein
MPLVRHPVAVLLAAGNIPQGKSPVDQASGKHFVSAGDDGAGQREHQSPRVIY